MERRAGKGKRREDGSAFDLRTMMVREALKDLKAVEEREGALQTISSNTLEKVADYCELHTALPPPFRKLKLTPNPSTRHRRRQRMALLLSSARTRARQGAHLSRHSIASQQSRFLPRRCYRVTASPAFHRGCGWEEADHRAREEVFRVGDGEDGRCPSRDPAGRFDGLSHSPGALVPPVVALGSSIGADPRRGADRTSRPFSRLHHPIPH
jgi:hypothetical protein